jgi:hypothetical protein
MSHSSIAMKGVLEGKDVPISESQAFIQEREIITVSTGCTQESIVTEGANSKTITDIQITFESININPPSDPLNEYLDDIYSSIKKEELDTISSLPFGYLEVQTDINEQMRSILVDWLVEVSVKFKLKLQTLFITVYLIDKYLSVSIITRTKLQLLGVTSMFIACKFEEIYTPHIKDFVYITDKAYSIKEVLNMELDILKSLSFHVVTPTPINFYQLIAKKLDFNTKEIFFGYYLMESFLLEYRYTMYSPSLIAVSTGYIVLKFFNKDHKSLFRHFLSSDCIKTLKECARDICAIVDNSENTDLNAAKRKYSSKEYEKVSLLRV